MISKTKSHSPNRSTKTIVNRRTKSHSPSTKPNLTRRTKSRRKSLGTRRSQKRNIMSIPWNKPAGFTPGFKLIKATEIVPENELTTGEEYLVKIGERKYRGVLNKLKDKKGCYVFKYLQHIDKDYTIDIDNVIWHDDDDDIALKTHAHTNNETILSLEDLKGMKQVGHFNIGETIYVRFVDIDQGKLYSTGDPGDNDVEYHGQCAFRGTYQGEINHEWVFSNIVEINKEVCGNVTFHYAAKAAKEKNRQTRVFSKLIPGFYAETRY